MTPYSPEAWNAFLEQLSKILAAAAWPGVVLAIFIVFSAQIRSTILSVGRFFDRTKKVTHGDTSFEAEHQALEVVGEAAGSIAEAPAQDPVFDAVPLWQLRFDDLTEAQYGTWLDKIRADVEDLGDPPPADLEQRFLYTLAQSNREVGFLRILRVIFGTQLELLVQLAADTTLDADKIDEVYQRHVQIAGQNARPKAAWIGFLVFHGLLDGGENGAQRTQIGSDFVRYANELGDRFWTKAW